MIRLNSTLREYLPRMCVGNPPPQPRRKKMVGLATSVCVCTSGCVCVCFCARKGVCLFAFIGGGQSISSKNECVYFLAYDSTNFACLSACVCLRVCVCLVLFFWTLSDPKMVFM